MTYKVTDKWYLETHWPSKLLKFGRNKVFDFTLRTSSFYDFAFVIRVKHIKLILTGWK